MPDEHGDHVEKLLKPLDEAIIALKFKKCEFFTNHINYLGHVIRPARLKVSAQTIDAYLDWRPSSFDESPFFTLCNVLPRLPIFDCIAALMNKNLNKDQFWTFDLLMDDEIAILDKL